MPLPNVKFEELNGALGGSNPSNDGISGLIITGVAAAGLALATPKAVFSLDEVKALGIDEDYDSTNSLNAYSELKEFYEQAGEGQELWIMIVSQATELEDICDVNNTLAKKLLQDSMGRIRIWGVSPRKADGYVADQTNGIDADVYAAASKAQSLCVAMKDKFVFTRCLLPGREWDGSVANLTDLTQSSDNRVAIVMLGSKNGKEARIGFTLGLLSSLAVQRNIGRVANGDIGLQEAYLTDGATRAEDIYATQDIMHDKGYIFPIVRPGRNGYFFNDDPTATSKADDFSSLGRGRVIDKIMRLAYDVYLDFVNDDYAVAPDGSISPAELKRLQGSIKDVVNAQMTSPGEISGFDCWVDPVQDVLATGQTRVKLKTQPKAYHKEIVVEVGFSKTLE